jgi:hypothetical protein
MKVEFLKNLFYFDYLLEPVVISGDFKFFSLKSGELGLCVCVSSLNFSLFLHKLEIFNSLDNIIHNTYYILSSDWEDG